MFYLKESWYKYLWSEFKKPYMKNIEAFLDEEISLWKIIFPKYENIFNALNILEFEDIKVVIIWQDPYHWEWQAHGLSFSVPDGIKIPPSLRNIFKEINLSLGVDITMSWDLSRWSTQWVLLLNSILTVESSKPASHNKIWWEILTDEIIKIISYKKKWVIFLLWWKYAQKKEGIINTSKHYILKSSHPSPFSAYRWFLWSDIFNKTNNILEKIWKEKIKW